MPNVFSKKIVQRFIFVALFASIIAAIALAVLVHYIPVAKTDIAITTELQENNSHAFYLLMRSVSFLGDPLVAAGTIIVVAILLIAIQYQREALFMLFVPIADLIGSLIKNLIERPRPSEFLIRVYAQAEGYSFPSGHVIHIVVFFGYLFTLMFVIKRIPYAARIVIAIFSLCMIILISISRIYLGAHWASDVIGGYLVALPLLAILVLSYLRVTRANQL